MYNIGIRKLPPGDVKLTPKIVQRLKCRTQPQRNDIKGRIYTRQRMASTKPQTKEIIPLS